MTQRRRRGIGLGKARFVGLQDCSRRGSAGIGDLSARRGQSLMKPARSPSQSQVRPSSQRRPGSLLQPTPNAEPSVASEIHPAKEKHRKRSRRPSTAAIVLDLFARHGKWRRWIESVRAGTIRWTLRRSEAVSVPCERYFRRACAQGRGEPNRNRLPGPLSCDSRSGPERQLRRWRYGDNRAGPHHKPLKRWRTPFFFHA